MDGRLMRTRLALVYAGGRTVANGTQVCNSHSEHRPPKQKMWVRVPLGLSPIVRNASCPMMYNCDGRILAQSCYASRYP